MTSCMLIVIGLITGVAVNYHGLLFKPIHVQLAVMIKYVVLITCMSLRYASVSARVCLFVYACVKN